MDGDESAEASAEEALMSVIPELRKIPGMTSRADHAAESASDIQIIIHVGAHKTATTYLQARLALNATTLLKRRVFFVRTGVMRKAFLQLHSTYSLWNIIPMVRSWRKSGVYRKFLAEAGSAQCARMIISEENLLGSIALLVKAGQFYPDSKARLGHVFQGLNRRPVTVLLAVRSYESFFASVCSQCIRSEGYWKIDDEIKARLFALARGWFEVIEDIMEILPMGSQLRIWRYEDFTKDETPMVTLLVREENLGCLTPLDSRPLPRLSIRAMKRLEELHAAGKPTGPVDVMRVGKRFSIEKGCKPFTPWTDEENVILARRYDQDIARIRERWPGIMIPPHDTGHGA